MNWLQWPFSDVETELTIKCLIVKFVFAQMMLSFPVKIDCQVMITGGIKTEMISSLTLHCLASAWLLCQTFGAS